MLVLAVVLGGGAVRAATYFVNDASTNGDVYCSAAGVDGATRGTNAATPSLTLASLFSFRDIEPGDTIYVDTGLYNNFSVLVGAADSGTAASNVVIQGSTNRAAGGSVFSVNSAVQNGFEIDTGASWLTYRDFTVRNAQYAFSIAAPNQRFERITVSGCVEAFRCGATNHTMRGCVAVGNALGVHIWWQGAGPVRWDSGVFWSNTVATRIAYPQYPLSISNSVVVGGTLFASQGDSLPVDVPRGDYNVLWNVDLASYGSLHDLQRAGRGWTNSAYADPLFADGPGGDFHPRSIEGTYSNGTYTVFAEHSPLIDLGNPSESFSNEPAPNGARIDVGAFGNSTEASLSRTNAWLLPLTYNDGGEVIGTGRLAWAHGNIATTATVQLDYSPDDGAAWYPVATNIPIVRGHHFWNVSAVTSTPAAHWRITVETPGYGGLNATNSHLFTVRGLGVIELYVNDAATAGDAYCSAGGSDANSGLLPSAPMRTLTALFARYDLGSGDRIRVDTGVYTAETVTVSGQDGGTTVADLQIQGSTNRAGGGTRFIRGSASADGFLIAAPHVTLRDLRIEAARYGVNIANSQIGLDGVVAVSNSIGFFGSGSNVTFRRCVAAYNGSIGLSLANPGPGPWYWDQGVSWSNASAFRRAYSAYILAVSNSVVVGGQLWQPSGDTATVPLPAGDYNLLWNTTLAGQFNNLSELQKARSDWQWSAFGDPAFLDPAGLDFHPKSRTGTLAGDAYATQAVHSLAIDFGAHAAAYTNEPEPNGSRLNAGVHGNTAEASLSLTNPWLYALNFRDGGVLSVPTDTIRWNAGGMPTGATVRIEYSSDGGNLWQTVVTNLPAGTGAYTWTSTNEVSSRFARWRVVYEADPAVVDASPANFTFRNGPFVFYLNDASTVGDIYTLSTGSDTNLGTSSGAPKASLANLLSVHDVEPGDIIYLDTGAYTLPANPTLTSADAGSTSGYVRLQGSTNAVAGGSVLNRANASAGTYALDVAAGASYVELCDLTLAGAGTGVRVNGSSAIRLARVTLRNCLDGIQVSGASAVELDRIVARQNSGAGLYVASGTATVQRSVFWRNGTGLRADAGLLSLSNSVLVASGPASAGILATTTTVVRGNFNAFHAESNAVLATITSLGRSLDTLAAWQTETGADTSSLEGDPLFADPDAADFHLRTTAPGGRPLPAGGSTNDAVASVLLDAGSPAWAATNEPGIGSIRLDIGYWGDTEGASVPPSGDRLLAAAPTAGGYVRGTSTVHWIAGGSATSGTVSLDISVNGGLTWTGVSTGLPAATGLATWNSTGFSNTPAARWRVRHEQIAGLDATNAVFFAIRNGSRLLQVYVNDTYETNDHLTSASGAATNFSATASAPLDAPERVFTLFDLEPGDTVFIDAGVYALGSNLVVRRQDSGTTGQYVSIVGATNAGFAATVLDRGSSSAGAYAVQFDTAQQVALSNLTVRNARSGVFAASSSNLVLQRIRALGNAQNGFDFSSAQRVAIRRSVAAGNGARGLAATSSQVALDGCVVWSNTLGAVLLNGGSCGASNSLFKASGSGTYVVDLQSGGTWGGDWNDILAAAGARVGRLASVAYVDLAQWQQGGFTQDLRSLSHEPLFADPAAGDYHLMSTAGRVAPDGSLTNDAVTSPLIDAGSPIAGFAAEPAPNGGRIDQGPYGDDPEASRSPTNARLLALTFNSGGSGRSTNMLYWLAGGAAAAGTVTLQFSADDGATWTNIVSGIAATNGQYAWNSVPFGSSAIARWRVVSDAETNVLDATDTSFVLNNGPLTYYVNDGQTNGDVYCIAPGAAGNNGATPGSPRASLQDIVDLYPLRSGDRILIDTGTYGLSGTVTIGASDTGTTTNFISVRGSTNLAAGGSVFSRPGGAAFRIENNLGVALEWLRITNSDVGIVFASAQTCAVRDVSIAGGSSGIDIQDSPGLSVRRAAFATILRGLYQRGGGTVDADGCCFWGCGHAVYVESGGAGLTNSIVETTAANQYAYFLGAAATLTADYNDLYLTNGALAAYRATTPKATRWPSVGSWSAASGQDVRSLSLPPGFAAPAAGDFHLLSQGGRFTLAGALTNDAVSSPLIDAGSPSAVATNESAPNGGRINLGIHGNTARASRTPTNAALTIVAPNDGGRITSTGTLYWIARGAVTSHMATIQFSSDGGTVWQTLTSGIPAATGSYVWNTASVTGSPSCLWRIASVPQPAVFDTSDAFFALRNMPLRYYVNDTQTVGDVYSTAAGSTSNLGSQASAPALSVAQILAQYDLEPGDTVLVDAGVYAPASTMALGEFDGGSAVSPVVFQGSTDAVAGTVFSGRGFEIDSVDGIRLQDFVISNAATAIRLRLADYCGAARVTVAGGATGIEVDDSDSATFTNCIVRNVAGNGLYVVNGSLAAAFDSGVLWSNAVGARIDSGALAVRGSVLGALTASAVAYYPAGGTLTADYNDLVLRQGALVGYRPGAPFATEYFTVGQWARDFGQDTRSLSHEPLFGSESASDFHPRSSGGRWLASGGYTNDVDDSPLLDAGSPAMAFAREPLPNGGRIDVGAFGNSPQASLSPTGSSLLAVSFNDGGSARGIVALNWVARGAITAQTVRIEFSSDAGATWSVVATGVPAAAGTYAWNSTASASTPVGRWRVVGESLPAVADASDASFAVRNSNLVFYVNDASLTGDVYCTAAGQGTNTGASASSPRLSIQSILDSYDLESGDTVYIDTGTYALSSDLVFGRLDGGLATQRVRLVGSTNSAAGATVLNRQGGAYGIRVDQAVGVELANLAISNAVTAISLFQSDDALVQAVSLAHGSGGIVVDDSDRVAILNSSLRQCASFGIQNINAAALTVENCTLYNNLLGILAVQGQTRISNSAIVAVGAGRHAYYVSAGGTAAIKADRNLLQVAGGGAAAFVQASPQGVTYPSVSLWSRDTGNDLRSMTHDPRFADAAAGDFHPRSTAGRRVAGGSYTNDADGSPLLDAGSPVSPFALEPAPNGGRINVGRYGNDPEASLSPTNASLTAISFNDGGRVEGQVGLYWIARGHATGHTVRVEFSADDGLTWSAIATNLPAGAESNIWNTTLQPNTPLARWRIVSETDAAVADACDTNFAVRNGPLAFYVNDAAVAGDVYCTAPGNGTNHGASAAAPRSSVQSVLDGYDVEPGDTIYIDTGLYVLGAAIQIGAGDAGTASQMVAIVGSTNQAAGGTILNRFGGDRCILADTAPGLALRNLTLRNAAMAGARLLRCDFARVEDLRVENCGVGLDFETCTGATARQCVVRNSSGSGVWIRQTALDFQHGVLWSNVTGLRLDSGSLILRHAVVGVHGGQASGLFLGSASLVSDYNCYFLTNGGAVASATGGFSGGGTSRYDRVGSWAFARGHDLHSIAGNPLIADELTADFHPRSTQGRYLPGTGFVLDAVTSPLIDAGQPSAAVGAEPVPNGGRVNIGLHGGTTEASLTPTNPRLVCVSFNDGGTVTGVLPLNWIATGAATSHTVRVEFSQDGGVSYSILSTGISAAAGTYAWDTTGFGSTPLGVWRVVSETDGAISDASDAAFTLRTGGAITYYVNDASTLGDVYCSAIGQATNLGFTAASPLDSLKRVLATFDLEPGDRVFVDTGSYSAPFGVTLGQYDAGHPTNPVLIAGSTNLAAGGSVIDRMLVSSNTAGITFYQTAGIRLRDLAVINAGTGVELTQSPSCRVERVRASACTTGFGVSNCAPVAFADCLAFDNVRQGLLVDRSTVQWLNGAVWNSGTAVDLRQAELQATNSVLQASGAEARVYRIDATSTVRADRNDLLRTNGAYLAETQRPLGGADVSQTLTDWIQAQSSDRASLAHEPAFANPAGGDFHPRSVTGRFQPGSGFVADALHSPLIDAGDRGSAWTNEPLPNGGRINIGPYGNDGEASQSRTNAWLLAVTFNDGGRVSGTNTLVWTYGNLPATNLVTVEYSPDQGIEWYPIATDVVVSSESCTWDVSALPASSRALWRVRTTSGPDVRDEVDVPFVLRPAPLAYYINDASTNGDVYTTQPGNAANNGTTPATPLDSLQTLFADFSPGPGDTIYVDTGTYATPASLVFDLALRGQSGFPIRVVGSTNQHAGGTVLQGAAGSNAQAVVTIEDAGYIELANLRLQGGLNGLFITGGDAIVLRGLVLASNAAAAVQMAGSRAISLDRCTVMRSASLAFSVASSSGITLDRCVAWSNRAGVLSLEGSQAFIRNSIFHQSGTATNLYVLGQGAGIAADYNVYWLQNGARMGRNTFVGQNFVRMIEWQNGIGGDHHSLLADPLFADAAAGEFHLKSESGRAVAGGFTNDAVTSPAIDAADPVASYDQETAPNGSRMNAGAEGNTAEASRSPATPRLIAGSLPDGGTVTGNQVLYWVAQGFGTNDLVNVDYSPNGGVTWTGIVAGVPAIGTGVLWNSGTFPASPAGQWRVVSAGDTNLFAVSASNFLLRTGPVDFYVNDTSTVGDVYCTAVGTATNNGLSPSTPMDSLQRVFDAYDLEGGDRIRIDTGVYALTGDQSMSLQDGGAATARVSIVGSTNHLAGGTVLSRGNVSSDGTAGLVLSGVAHVNLANLTIRRADQGLRIFQSSSIAATNVVLVENGNAGLRVDQSSGCAFDRLVVSRSSSNGVSLQSGGLTLSRCAIWSNAGDAVVFSSATLAVSNSVLHARGAGRFCYRDLTNSVLAADYNNLHVEPGAYFGVTSGGLAVESLPQWTALRGVDRHSLAVDPRFAAPAQDNYRLRSVTGRYVPTSGLFVADAEHSALIDAGSPTLPFAGEPAPNGGRANIGPDAGTGEASMSRTNAWLMALTASSGGRLSGSLYLDWLWGGVDATNKVDLQYSYDDGASWVDIATAVDIAADGYPWDSTVQVSNEDVFVSSPVARWRVVLATDTNVQDMTDRYFALRNVPFVYYVNDASTAGDLYTTATGSDTNLGLFKYAPKATLESLLASLDAEGGDIIEIDTGLYSVTNSFGTLTLLDSGREGEPVVLKGSTNAAGSILRRAAGSGPLLSLTGPHLIVRDLRFEGAGLTSTGDHLDLARITLTNGSLTLAGDSLVISNVAVRNGSMTFAGASAVTARQVNVGGGSIALSDVSGGVLANASVWGAAAEGLAVGGAGAVAVSNCSIAVTGNGVSLSGSVVLQLRNSIVVASGADRFCIARSGGILLSDYNDLVARNGAWIGSQNGYWERLLYWQRETGQDVHSLAHEPLFVSEATGDLHLRSLTGRFTNGTFAADATHSPAIDAGFPASPGAETAPNGGVINLGAYGGTAEASRSRTNDWVLAVTANDGGVVKGGTTLRWLAGGSSTNTVRLEYSADGGTSWVTVAGGLAATNGSYAWNSASVTSSLRALWRVTVESTTGVVDTVDTFFAVRNAPLTFYVNNATTNGDVYTSAAGSAGNDGLAPTRPMDSLARVLNTYDLEAGDTVLVDTGVHAWPTNQILIWSDGGDSATSLVAIVGSTNSAAGGTVLSRGSLSAGSDALDIHASFVQLRDIGIRDAHRALIIASNRGVTVRGGIFSSNETAIVATQAVSAVIANLLVLHNRQGGIDIADSRTSTVENCTFDGNVPFAVRTRTSTAATIQNNVFAVPTNGANALDGQLTSIFIDYNLYQFDAMGASIHPTNAGQMLLNWQLRNGHDYRSATTNADFANQAGQDLHLKSQIGRYVDGAGWTTDAVTSWGVDRGNPATPLALEPAPSGNRVNLGAYGGTRYASYGTTQAVLQIRQLNGATEINSTNSLWPLIWGAVNVPTGHLADVQFSGDGGLTWFTLATNISPYQEVLLWQTTPFFNTYQGRWRVIDVTQPAIAVTNAAPFGIFYGEFGISTLGADSQGRTEFVWRGAWGEDYRIQYATNMAAANAWFTVPAGVLPAEQSVFTSTNGGDFLFRDVSSTGQPHRAYRVIREGL